jgi:hypothetical protein
VLAYPVVFLINKNGVIEAAHGRTRLALPDGLENLESTLRTKLDLLLGGKTRDDFPSLVSATPPSDNFDSATQPASIQPAEPRLVVDPPQFHERPTEMGTQKLLKVYYRNTGTKPLELIDIRTSDAVELSTDWPRVLPPGGIGVLQCRVFEEESGSIVIRSTDPGQSVQRVAW